MIEKIEPLFFDASATIPVELEEELEQKEHYKAVGTKLKNSKTLIQFARALRADTKKDFDNVIVVTGEREGIGKSTFCIQCSRVLDSKFELARNVVYDPDVEQVKSKMEGLPRYTPIVFDEAVKVLFNQEWHSKAATFLNKYYKVSRKFNQISFMAIPHIKDMNSKFLNSKVLWHVHIIERGLAVVFKRDWVYLFADPWHLATNERMCWNKLRFQKVYQVNREMKLNLYARLRNFVSFVTFDDLPKEMKQEYRELSEEASRKFDMLQSPEAKVKNHLEGVLSKIIVHDLKGGASMEALARRYKIKSALVRSMMKKGGYSSIKDLKIEVKEETKRKQSVFLDD